MPKLKQKEFVCKYCGKIFLSSSYTGGRIPFACSMECKTILSRKEFRGPVKPREKKLCLNCNKEFISKRKETSCCSRKCSGEYRRKNYTNFVKIVCLECKKELSVPYEFRNRKYCSSECSRKNDIRRFIHLNISNNGKSYEEIYGEEKAKEKKEIMSKRNSKPLLERGYTEEMVKEFKTKIINRNKNNIGKIFEELYGEEKAKEIKEKKSIVSRGDSNPMSLQSIAIRNSCSLEKASELTPSKGRIGKLHPMFGKHHSLQSKIKIIKTAKQNGYPNSKMFSCGFFDGILWQGTWELKYIIDCKEKNIPIRRYDLEPFEYDFNGEAYHYFPDFIINENTIIEIKGFDKNKEKTIYKMEMFKNKFNNFEILYKINTGTSAKNFLREMKEKYSERLVINYNPHEKELNENS